MLNELKKLSRPARRKGRGGDRGGTSGKGNKGQKARSGGGVRPQFEGGQTPLTRRLPKRGFNNTAFAIKYTIIHLGHLQSCVGEELIITKDILVQLGIIKNTREKVKLLANQDVQRAVTVHVDACSIAAKSRVEAVGGQVIITKQ